MGLPGTSIAMLSDDHYVKKILFITVGRVAQTANQQYSGKLMGSILISIASFLETLNTSFPVALSFIQNALLIIFACVNIEIKN